jgi:hypothetical protein
MKNLIALAAVTFAVSLLGCQDTKEERTGMPDVSAFKKIGMEIPLETGIEWMSAFEEKYNAQGRLLSPDYNVSDVVLESAFESVTSLTGVAFHHAIDEAGEHHFIVIPVDPSLSLWTNIEGREYIDANTSTVISKEVARAWAQNYEQANPGQIWFHFFGSNIFDEIFDLPYFHNLEIEPAISTLNLTPQLLLIINADDLVNTDSVDSVSIGGRYKTETTKVYDASSPCPPCPVN